MRKFVTGVIAVCTGMALLCSCDAHRADRVVEKQIQPVIAAGPNEKTFSQRYDLPIALPMSRQGFVSLVDGLHLRWREEKIDMIPKPYWTSGLDMSIVSQALIVDAGYDERSRVTERYRVYIDRDDNVVYIENAFVYPDVG